MIRLSESMIKYVRLQRTGLGEEIDRQYHESVERDWNQIKDHISDIGSVLDIGCGIAGIDYFIGKAYPEAELNLLDTVNTDTDIYYGYRERGCLYNDLNLAEDFLRLNDIENTINLYRVDQELGLPKSDLVISLISWGFHYPVRAYIKEVTECLNPGGSIIMDLRKDIPESFTELTDYGYDIELIAEGTKYHRIKATK